MKKVYLLLLLNSLFINTQAQNFNWAKREGLYQYDYGYGITTDNTGNMYVAGKYEMNAIFSGDTLPWQGNHDIYVAQYSSTGALNWIRTAGGPSGDYAHAIACDGSNLYVAGEIEGPQYTIKFVGSPITLTTKSSNDAFIAKYDLNGNLLWARSAGAYQDDKAQAVAYDKDGNVYMAGFFNDTAYFGTTTIYGKGLNDIFIAKYDKDGNFLWVHQAGSAGRDEAKGIQCDAAGNVYVCGLYTDGCIFGTQTLTSPGGFFNTFLAKYAPDGTLTWVKTAGGDYDDVAWSLTMDNAGKIYVAGEFNAYAGFGSIYLTTSGQAEAFVACYDASGNVQWATPAGGNQLTRARGIGCDGTNLYITGQFGGTAAFGTTSLTAVDSSDIFMAKINNTGTFMWATSVTGPADTVETLGYESGNAICAEASGNVYATGSLLSGGTFGSTTLTPYAHTDVFITKITQGPDVTAPLAIIYSPADNSTNVPVNSNLVITFNEAIQKGTGNIIIKESGVVTQTIPVAGTNVTVSGNTVTINSADFTNGASVNVEMAAGVFTDMANNNYAGITDATSWNFAIGTTRVSIPEISTTTNINIYPNPSNGSLSIDLSNITDQQIALIIVNNVGETVVKRINISPSLINIDLSILTTGVYFIVINGEHTNFRNKIIIQ
jgi:hypothetical protein